MAALITHVDDILIAAMPDELEALQQALSAIFPISDWEEDTFDYIGSQVEQRDGKILISQENYVDSRLETIEIPKGVVMDDLGRPGYEAGTTRAPSVHFLGWLPKLGQTSNLEYHWPRGSRRTPPMPT